MRPRYSKTLKQKILEAAEACDPNRMAMLLPKATKNDMNNALIMATKQFCFANRYKKTNCVRLLLEAGVDPDALYDEWNDGVTALFYLSRAVFSYTYSSRWDCHSTSIPKIMECLRLVQQLVESGANLNHITNDGKSLLQWTHVYLSYVRRKTLELRISLLEFLVLKGLNCRPLIENMYQTDIENRHSQSKIRATQQIEQVYVRVVQSKTREAYFYVICL